MALKPSELSPATSAFLAKLIPHGLSPEEVVVVEGGVEVAKALIDHPWNHIFLRFPKNCKPSHGLSRPLLNVRNSGGSGANLP